MLMLWFVLVLVLGLVGNATAFKQNAFREYPTWFWNVVWIIALRATWPM